MYVRCVPSSSSAVRSVFRSSFSRLFGKELVALRILHDTLQIGVPATTAFTHHTLEISRSFHHKPTAPSAPGSQKSLSLRRQMRRVSGRRRPKSPFPPECNESPPRDTRHSDTSTRRTKEPPLPSDPRKRAVRNGLGRQTRARSDSNVLTGER